MKENIKDYLKSLSAKHLESEQDNIPETLESVVKEPSNPSDLSDIYTTQYKPRAEAKTGKSVILRDMIVHGNIESGTDIEIMGTVMGEVTSEGRIYVSGTVTGNISGKNVTICTKEVNANVIAIERVSIERDTVINGNVTADFLIVNGNVNGNIKANKELVVMAGATIKGDIEAQTMEVNRGAVINGKVSFQVNQEEANS